MAAGDKTTLGFNAEQELVEEIETIRERKGHDHRSAVLRELVEIGMREQRHPLLYHARGRALDVLVHLSLVAAVIGATSYITDIMAPGDGMAVAIVTLTMGFVPVAAVEMARTAAGMNELGRDR